MLRNHFDLEPFFQIVRDFYNYRSLEDSDALWDFDWPCTGGVLHVVLDDGNMEDHFIERALHRARAGGDKTAEYVAKALQLLTYEQRRDLWNRRDEYRQDVLICDLPISVTATLPSTGVLNIEPCLYNPAIIVPELRTLVMGSESWWSEITSASELRDITDDNIMDAPYMQLLKSLLPEEPHAS